MALLAASNGVGFYFGQMLGGLGTTFELTAVGAVVSLALGALLALARMRANAWVRRLIIAYVELVRGLPVILQLFVFYFGLTQFGFNLSPLTAAFIWMCFYGIAYGVEIFRAGFEGIHFGQEEASRALGMGPLTTLWRVTLPQAVALMLPPLTNFLILLLKNTTLVYIIGVHEVIYEARVASGATSNPLEIYGIAALIYIVINTVLARAAGLLQHRMSWAR